MKRKDVMHKKKKTRATPEAINPALSFETQDPVTQRLKESWDDFKEKEPALKTIPHRHGKLTVDRTKPGVTKVSRQDYQDTHHTSPTKSKGQNYIRGLSHHAPHPTDFSRTNSDRDAGRSGPFNYMRPKIGVVESEPVDENLKKWFKEKWVRFGPDGKIRGECGGRDEGEGKPKCLPASKAHSLGKKGRASAAARKRREDPNPERSGAAINVATKKKTTEGQEYCPECGGSMYPDTMINEKKDACYYKVKSRYKVWPSAYASGALVRCRKKGSKNWGSKSKNESVEESQLEEKWSEKYKRSIDCSHPRGFSQRAHCQGRKKNEDQQLDEKCWDTHKQVGMKKKGGRMVPNCLPKESVNEANMKDVMMDIKDLSDGEFFEKYKKSKGQMQNSLEPMYVVKDPASYNDDDFYAYDPNTKILKSTWSSNSVGRWASEADAQRQGLSIARGLRARSLGLKIRRRLQGMLETSTQEGKVIHGDEPMDVYLSGKNKKGQPIRTLVAKDLPSKHVSAFTKAIEKKHGVNPLSVIAGPRKKVAEDQENPFVVYVNKKPVAKFDTPEEAKRAAYNIHFKMPSAYIDLQRTICTDELLRTIAENENLYI